ncbi:hypothetical protein D9611_014529 [Ephemerocybe angulata]|uniref:U3 small nucleolar ribonucleoprotein protein IMP4 n=1 Tax=Ephemerocybe angulata TaxID=980116 RepID=A0A8H5C9R9_9AGAR|nr:hypothetical protein D9611_014529 [Tulosesus angulatus]
MRLVFPNSHRINRGNYVVKELAEACRANDVTDLIVVHEHRGVPDAMIVSHFPHGPTVYFTLSNVNLRHDIATYKNSTVSEQYPHLIFEGFSSKLGERVQDVLKYLFPVPKEDSKRVMTFANDSDFISFRHHVFVKTGRTVELAEVGPRMEMKPYEIRQGTIEQNEAEKVGSVALHTDSQEAERIGRLNIIGATSKEGSRINWSRSHITPHLQPPTIQEPSQDPINRHLLRQGHNTHPQIQGRGLLNYV